jgi:putative effector of murein hydrolase LrgA (UPF0299 family)
MPIISMKPDAFHHALTEIIEYCETFLKTLRAMLISPRAAFAAAAHSGEADKVILPGAFLFINLAIAELISAAITELFLAPSSLVSGGLREWLFLVPKEIPSHIIGTLLLLLLLKVFFWKVRTMKLLAILCFTSIVFVPYAIIMVPVNSVLGTSFLSFLTSALSGHYRNVSELFAPVFPPWYKVIPLSSLLAAVLIWWVWLLSAGCSQVSALSRSKRIFRLCYSIAGYIMVFVIVFTIYFFSISYSAPRGYVDYDKMVTAFKNQGYAEAFFLSSSVTHNGYVLPVMKYHAYLISGISGIKMLWKTDPIFKDAILDINDVLEHRAHIGKYRDAELIMAKEIKARLLSMEDPMRGALYNAASAIKEADKQYKSPLYSEAKTQSLSVMPLTRDIPIDFFP